MASSGPDRESIFGKRNNIDANNFHRLVGLQYECGTTVLRKYLTFYISKIRKTNVNDFLKGLSLKLQTEIKDLTLDAFDITLLTKIILDECKPTGDIKKAVRALRECRNEIAHNPKGEINGKSQFNKASQNILTIAISLGDDVKRQFAERMNELHQSELVRSYSIVDIIKYNEELLEMRLVYSAPDGEQATSLEPEVIKLMLCKWSRQLARISDVSSFLERLKQNGVINEMEKRHVEQAYSSGGQIEKLILYIVQHATKETTFKFCAVLRERHPHLADLIEMKEHDGLEIDEYLASQQRRSIMNALQDLTYDEEGSKVECEMVHIKVEEWIQTPVTFRMLVACLKELFPGLRYEEGDARFFGLQWKQRAVKTDLHGGSICATTKTDILSPLPSMDIEEFSIRVGKEVGKIRQDLELPFQEAFRKEDISPSIFVSMEKDELNKYIGRHLKDPITLGVEKTLLIFQNKVKDSLNNTQTISDNTYTPVRLREFDHSPKDDLKYPIGPVKTVSCGLLEPVHKFVHLTSLTKYHIAKETVQFIQSCMNGFKNGTIHFGIQTESQESGQIVGLSTKALACDEIDAEIHQAILDCFIENQAHEAMFSSRPVQSIPVEGTDKVVYEIDVVPSANLCTDEMITVSFPPKGPQHQVCFMYDAQNVSFTIEKEKLRELSTLKKGLRKTRLCLETARWNDNCGKYSLQRSLAEKLKGRGMKYVTDELDPFLVLGPITGYSKEDEIRSTVRMEHVFASCKFILDFDDSPKLRKLSEKDSIMYRVLTTEDIKNEKSISLRDKPWIYCNGLKDCALAKMNIVKWTKLRLQPVRTLMNIVRNDIQIGRALAVVLVFHPLNEADPLFEVRDWIKSTFRNECLVITDDEKNIQELKDSLRTVMKKDELDKCFHTGLKWSEISSVMSAVFKLNADVACKLPCGNGFFVTMTSKDKQSFTDIEVIGGDERARLGKLKTVDEQKEKCRSVATDFYKGRKVSWWNFKFENQVGKRNDFDEHRCQIKEKLKSKTGMALVEEYEIMHHPGAGGTTLGRHLLWHFSQFQGEPQKAYRCCLVTCVSENTVEQIVRFREFRDKNHRKPFIVLVDNQAEESILQLRRDLNEAAYKNGQSGKLFCLVIYLTRVPVSGDKQYTKDKRLLTHSLTGGEKHWFDKKFQELEERDDIDVNTLILFNVLRHSFDKEYIANITSKLMEEIESKEGEILQILCLICSYETDQPVPQTIFDEMMRATLSHRDLELLPYGIMHSVRQLEQLKPLDRENIWNINKSDALALLTYDIPGKGIGIISQPLAKAILEYFKKKKNISLIEMVDNALALAEKHSEQTYLTSAKFVRMIGMLFKTRQVEENKKQTKLKFSALVLDLEKDGNKTVLERMKRCFEITKDAMVGQQLARFYIHIEEYESAKKEIQNALDIKPNNAYLADTYGQIYKEELKVTKKKYLSRGEEANNKFAGHLVTLGLKAVEKFRAGQDMALKTDDDRGMRCYQNEVKTSLFLLEIFERFKCYVDRREFCRYLNDRQYDVKDSPFKDLYTICPEIELLRNGSDWQTHLDSSLRYLEETSYQVRNYLHCVSKDDEVLLLTSRESFERFYGDLLKTEEFRFKYGLGLKPLMKALNKEPERFAVRVAEAKSNIEGKRLSHVDKRDLLVFLGDAIIRTSDRTTRSKQANQPCSNDEYRQLLRCSTGLVVLERKLKGRKYLESYLYYAMLHWPLQSRVSLALETLASANSYTEILKEWNRVYKDNHFIMTPELNRVKKPKNYFAVGNGTPGCDIVDLESIRKEWKGRKKASGRYRRPVFRDHFWKEDFVEDELLRLTGIVDGDGLHIAHEVIYHNRKRHTFAIKTYYPCEKFSNRPVTFVLGFTWREPRAFDVRAKDDSLDMDELRTSQGTSSDSDETEIIQQQDSDTEQVIKSDDSSGEERRSIKSQRLSSDTDEDLIAEPQASITPVRPKLYNAAKKGKQMTKGEQHKRSLTDDLIFQGSGKSMKPVRPTLHDHNAGKAQTMMSKGGKKTKSAIHNPINQTSSIKAEFFENKLDGEHKKRKSLNDKTIHATIKGDASGLETLKKNSELENDSYDEDVPDSWEELTAFNIETEGDVTQPLTDNVSENVPAQNPKPKVGGQAIKQIPSNEERARILYERRRQKSKRKKKRND
ncbi:LOW QUALITY PROTEIN: sterile alpha motif domain-containing protein 9-like [Mya arenaria]|uniref:LOW QUALITY PROTEIN: sterile alpha motif domain-containing protein 9-like n=1 Tax=Mya arenaria TaxID=6604 RepID=UPI0022E531D3|nr:LOW QUALITY PROTEIN: sterile alpha motif domain-containing protein 9-like [Mya arenaria]